MNHLGLLEGEQPQLGDSGYFLKIRIYLHGVALSSQVTTPTIIHLSRSGIIMNYPRHLLHAL